MLNSVPLKELPRKAYVYRAWHYLARSDLCMWRKEYHKAIEWAEKSQDQFTRGKVLHINNPQERLKLLNKLQSQETHKNNELDEMVDLLHSGEPNQESQHAGKEDGCTTGQEVTELCAVSLTEDSQGILLCVLIR